MVFYKIIRINIIKETSEKESETKKSIKSDLDVKTDTDSVDNSISEEQSINDIESIEPGIKLTINDIPSLSINPCDKIDDNHYVTITACFNWRVTNTALEDLSKTYLIGTNILIKLGDVLPTIKLDTDSGSIKYKKIVRDNSKKLFNISNKDIITIKHLNNIDNYHNYLVLLKQSKKLARKFKNSMNCVDKDTFKWRSYFGLYRPDKINPSKAEIYSTLSKDKYITNTLSIDKSEIKLKDIYKTLSYVIGEEVF